MLKVEMNLHGWMSHGKLYVQIKTGLKLAGFHWTQLWHYRIKTKGCSEVCRIGIAKQKYNIEPRQKIFQMKNFPVFLQSYIMKFFVYNFKTKALKD